MDSLLTFNLSQPSPRGEGKRVGVEIDGGIHEEQKDYDKLRDQIINQYGIKVIRFTNEEVVNRSDWVLAKIKELAYPVDKRL